MPIPEKELPSVCLEIANGDTMAADALVRIARIVRLADDIVDGHGVDAQSEMAEILCLALVDLPRNPFYAQNAALLSAPWLVGILGWQAGDEWRHSDSEKTRMFGFVYREAIEHVAHVVAYLTGGHDHARQAMRLLHEVSHAQSPETFTEWENE